MTSFIELMHYLAPQGPELRLLAAGVVVVIVGSRLGDYGDVFAKKLGLGHALVGLIMMAFATSVPELVTEISAAVVQDEPNLCLGDTFGSNLFNLSIIAVIDIIIGRESLFSRVALKMAVAGAVSVVVMGVMGAAMAVELASPGTTPALLGMGLGSWVAAVAYILGAWLIKDTEESLGIEPGVHEPDEDRTEASLAITGLKYFLAVCVILWAGLNLSRGGDDLARKWGIGQSFVGSIFLALATSLPELASSIAMVRKGYYDMAFGNLFGSNAFNIMVLVAADMAYRKDILIRSALSVPDGRVHFATMLVAVIMTAVAIIGIVVRPKKTKLRLSWPGAAIIGLYAVGAYLLYLLSAASQAAGGAAPPSH